MCVVEPGNCIRLSPRDAEPTSALGITTYQHSPSIPHTLFCGSDEQCPWQPRCVWSSVGGRPPQPLAALGNSGDPRPLRGAGEYRLGEGRGGEGGEGRGGEGREGVRN